MAFVEDANAYCATARAAGVRILAQAELRDHGPGYWADRGYGCLDPESHL